jgi:hypothetical protein
LPCAKYLVINKIINLPTTKVTSWVLLNSHKIKVL